jgi:hypothetical protein
MWFISKRNISTTRDDGVDEIYLVDRIETLQQRRKRKIGSLDFD